MKRRGRHIPFYYWTRCGWCGQRNVPVHTDGRMIFCGHCGH